MNKKVHIIGGGTVSHVRAHLALSAPAYGETARKLYNLCETYASSLNMDLELHLTKMASAGKSNLETNFDILSLICNLITDQSTKIIFMNAALCDFNGSILQSNLGGGILQSEIRTASDKYASRLDSKNNYNMHLIPAQKVIGRIRETRKDIFLIGFKTTNGATEQEQYLAGLNLVKQASCNLVLANDIGTRTNMIITPEEATYHVTKDRNKALINLVDMTYFRSDLNFTRSTVVEGDPIPWNSELIPKSLQTVVNYCIAKGAYKVFNGSTVGHFAAKIDEETFLTSRRKTNFNNLDTVGLVMVKSDGLDSVIAYGSKPSVGGMSQRIIFKDHPDSDCIVHFHCPLRSDHEDSIPIRSQREVECGSMQCGKNTSSGLKQFGNIKAVMLDNHGPNIVFNRNTNPNDIITFIEQNFDLSGKTGGYSI